jgi:hypothetical protein
MSTRGLLFQWASTINVQLSVLVSPWYSWKIPELALSNNHSLTLVPFISFFFFISFRICLEHLPLEVEQSIKLIENSFLYIVYWMLDNKSYLLSRSKHVWQSQCLSIYREIDTNMSTINVWQSQCLSIYREIDPDVHHLILTFAVSSSISMFIYLQGDSIRPGCLPFNPDLRCVIFNLNVYLFTGR